MSNRPAWARRASRTAAAVSASLKIPPRFKPGHFYSVLTDPQDCARADNARRNDASFEHLPGWDAQRSLATLASVREHFTETKWSRYRPDEMYVESDALILAGMMREYKPRRIIEVGSGFSTAVMLDVSENLDPATAITCVEPYPERLRSLVSSETEVCLLSEPVQDVDIEIFKQLEANDILFIDSSHVLKAGSDVYWLFTRVLPALHSGVIVHIHDCFWPFEYPSNWLAERRDWNELYFLETFLTGNPSWRVLLFNDHAWQQLTGHDAPHVAHLLEQRPGGFWMQRTD